jgi:hypothetical protein
MLPKPLLNDDQWRVINALERAGKAINIVPMPGTRLQHWFREPLDRLLNSRFDDAAQKKLARQFAHQFYQKTIELALVKIEGGSKHLGMVITEDELVTQFLSCQGVKTITWSTALDYLHRGQASSLIDITENIVACGRAAPAIKVHTEEAHLKRNIAQQLHLAWPDELDSTKIDADTVLLVNAELEKQKSKFSVFRDVAVSCITSVSADEQIDSDMQRVFDTSDVDFVIHGKAPHNIPLLAVEYDGESHRTNPRKIATDKAKDRLLAAAGIALLRIGTDVTRSYSPGEVMERQHLRLSPILRIAKEILERSVILRTRADEDRRLLVRDMGETSTIAKALYDKKMAKLDMNQLENAWKIQQSALQLECSLTDAERAADDLDDEVGHRLESHLEALGVDPACVLGFLIHSTRYGAVGKARLQLNDGSAIRSVETASVSLNAPFLPAKTVDQLITNQIHAELAYLASKLANSAQ